MECAAAEISFVCADIDKMKDFVMSVNRLFVVSRRFGKQHLEIKGFLDLMFSCTMNDELSIDFQKTKFKNLV